jgi:hypothetical protein
LSRHATTIRTGRRGAWEQILARIASITTMQPGTLAEEFLPGAFGKDGKPSRLGPYYKLQVWRDGADRTRRVSINLAN